MPTDASGRDNVERMALFGGWTIGFLSSAPVKGWFVFNPWGKAVAAFTTEDSAFLLVAALQPAFAAERETGRWEGLTEAAADLSECAEATMKAALRMPSSPGRDQMNRGLADGIKQAANRIRARAAALPQTGDNQKDQP